jgi:hypothetical protein
MPVMMQTIAEAAGIEGEWVNAYRKEELVQAFRILYSLMSQDTVPIQLEAKAATLLEIEKIQLEYGGRYTQDKTKKVLDVLTNLHYAEMIKQTANQTGLLDVGLGTNEQILALLAPPGKEAAPPSISPDADGDEEAVDGEYQET